MKKKEWTGEGRPNTHAANYLVVWVRQAGWVEIYPNFDVSPEALSRREKERSSVSRPGQARAGFARGVSPPRENFPGLCP